MVLAQVRPTSSGSHGSKGSFQIREVSKTLTAERREKLLAIQRREKMKEVLIDKFKKHNNRCPESVIKKEVSNFCQKAKVTEANLNRLERRIRNRAKNEKADKDDCGSQDGEADADEKDPDASTIPDDLVSNYSMPSLAPSRASHTSSLAELYKKVGRQPDDYDWSRLDEYAMFLHEQDATRQQIAEKEMQGKLKSYLDKQVAEREKKKQRHVEDEKRYYDNLLVELEDWEINERQQQEEFKNKMSAEKKNRDAQLEFDCKLRVAEQERKKTEEETMMKQIVEEIEQDKVKTLRKKVDEKKAIMKVFQENMADKKLKDAEVERLRQAELEEQNKAQRLMEEREAKRQAEIVERDKRQKTLIEQMKTEVQTAQNAQGKEDAIRAKQQLDEVNDMAREMETQKSKKLVELRHQTQDYLFMQMAEKDTKKIKALELKELQADVLKQDADEFKVAEEEKNLQRRLRNLEHRVQLENQIQEKHSQKSRIMSDSEISMNLDLINVVERTLKERDDIQEQRERLSTTQE
eukprot:GEMP01015480.1.p1 GENE.GEMP01015480.1~~GEMP01015480.1.p1  ORF type:complete len:522 (+),score=158.17 GEMP01015480.1:45-1610(+)